MLRRGLPLVVLGALALLAWWLLREATARREALEIEQAAGSARATGEEGIPPLPVARDVVAPGDAAAAPRRAAATVAPKQTPPAVNETIVWRPGTLDVQVRSSSGEPLAGVALALFRDGEEVDSQITDAGGRIEFRKRSTGTHLLQLDRWREHALVGFRYEAEVFIQGGETRRHDVTIPQAAQVTLAYAQPLPTFFTPASVTFIKDDGQRSVVELKEGVPATIPNVAPGRYEIAINGTQRELRFRGLQLSRAYEPGLKERRTIIFHLKGEFTAVAGASTAGRIAVPGGRVTLRVTPKPENRLDPPVHLISVDEELDKGRSVSGYPDQDGVLEVLGAPPGRYIVWQSNPKSGPRAEIQISGNNEEILVELRK